MDGTQKKYQKDLVKIGFHLEQLAWTPRVAAEYNAGLKTVADRAPCQDFNILST